MVTDQEIDEKGIFSATVEYANNLSTLLKDLTNKASSYIAEPTDENLMALRKAIELSDAFLKENK